MRTTGAVHLGSADRVGVTRVYGYPGEGVNGLIGAFHEVGEKLEQTRHEEIASLGACVHAQLQPSRALREDPHAGWFIKETLKGNVKERITR